MPKLTFKTAHKSIKYLPECNLPSLAIITGINGSGKTQLLEAIHNHQITTEGINNSDQVKIYNWSNFATQINNTGSPHNRYHQRKEALQQIIQHKTSALSQLPSFFHRHNISGSTNLDDAEWLAAASENQLIETLRVCTRNGQPAGPQAAHFCDAFAKHRQSIITNLENNFRPYGALLSNIRERQNDGNLLQLKDEDLDDALPGFWSQQDNILHLQLAEWFAAWHGAFEYNKINKFYATTEGDTSCKWITDEEFRKRYGPEPWALTNRILEEADIRYRFNRPEGNIADIHLTFQLKLTDPEDGSTIDPTTLSAGEKVMLAIVLLLFQSTEKAIIAALPKLLLLDEVDAPLHPSFTRSLLKIIKEELVDRCGISVIMTTHSPSTVALAPAGSIFELTRKPRVLRPITASAATQILSDGFVALAATDVITITESGADVGYYDAVFRGLCAENAISSTPGIKFIPASKSTTNLANGGCSQVRHWAPKLAQLGIGRFKGLVDMDSGVSADNVISVLKRYSWENYLFDPLCLLGYLIYRGIPAPYTPRLPPPCTLQKLTECGSAAIQALLNDFTAWLVAEIQDPDLQSSNNRQVAYLGWSEIQIPSWYISTRGHDLEAKLREVMNRLGIRAHRGALVKKGNYDELIHFQSAVAPKLLSQDLVMIFRRLQNSESKET